MRSAVNRWLGDHAGASCAASPVERRAAWLTGQSSWRHSALSPGQEAMLDVLADAGYATLRVGFPWTTIAATDRYRPESLVTASARNVAQFAAARRGGGPYAGSFAHQVARHLQDLLSATSDRLVLLVSSAGAEMLTCATPSVRTPPGLTVDVVAFGPFGRLPAARPNWTTCVVQGRDDRISRFGYHGPVDIVIPGTHLSASTSPAAREVLRRLAASWAEDSRCVERSVR